VLPLARLFDQVTALDPEPGMLQVANGVANKRESPTCAGAGRSRKTSRHSTSLVASGHFGQSFHRVSRLEVAEVVYDHLVPVARWS